MFMTRRKYSLLIVRDGWILFFKYMIQQIICYWIIWKKNEKKDQSFTSLYIRCWQGSFEIHKTRNALYLQTMLWVKTNKDWFGSGNHLVIQSIIAEVIERLFFPKTHKITENLHPCTSCCTLKRDLHNERQFYEV